MSIKETHEWAKEKAKNWSTLFDAAQNTSTRPNEKLIPPDDLQQFENPSFHGDVCRRDGDLIFHFFPTTNDRFNVKVDIQVDPRKDRKWIWVFNDQFADNLGDAFIEVFKQPERLFWDFVPELNSWVVRCEGFGSNPLNNILIERVLVTLKRKNNDD